MNRKDDIVIYLNEEDAKVYVKVPKGPETHFQLQNLPGKILQEAVHDKGLHDFDLAGLPDGNYFVIVNQDDYIRSKKIVLGYQP
ncbi:sugar isomerase [Jiulongibacter sediminis]|uniref:Sugar isomerase n=2 Tax=Jiulongibacter sediminis TaxID=1605367 RepID=A0A0N8H9C2_9BACT|nr:sugar isomerase [Jiulongibacter sediminis]TBX22310.1 sugar isomerase [Jiulongibacter sediminis]